MTYTTNKIEEITGGFTHRDEINEKELVEKLNTFCKLDIIEFTIHLLKIEKNWIEAHSKNSGANLQKK